MIPNTHDLSFKSDGEMNRIKLGPLANQAAPDTNRPTISQDQQFRGQGFEHCFFIPMHYEFRHAYPLVVWLHSAGNNHRQILDVLPKISTRNYVGVAVRGPDVQPDSGNGWLQSPDSIETAQNNVRKAIDIALGRFNINRSRIFIAGRDSGGTMAFRLAFARPDLFSGVASIGGSLPSNLTPLSNWSQCRKVPVFWVHGRNARKFPEPNLCHQLRLLHIAGFAVTLRQYPCGDEAPDQSFQDLNHWIMEQISHSGESNIVR